MNSTRLRLAGLGCGGRTRTYLSLASKQPDLFEIVGAADPVTARLDAVEAQCGSPPGFRKFQTDRELLAEEKFADVLVIGTQDQQHHEHCLAAIRRGYDVLLEKPIATTLPDILELEQEARRLGRRVLVCHVLRYTALYRKVKQLLTDGAIGEIIHLSATEGVGPWHQAHSFVRGHWAVVERATPMIIAKCCHDLDIILWLMDDHCKAVSSFGGLEFFRAERMPAGATLRCTDGCPHVGSCAFDAHRYLHEFRGWLPFVFDRAADASDPEIIEWLRSSPWGRCVYQCDNTAVDRQVVSMEFAKGAVAQLTMTAFATGRHLEIHGTAGVLRAGEAIREQTGSDILVVANDGTVTPFNTVADEGGYDGHGGGDQGLVNALHTAFLGRDPAALDTSLSASIESHVVGFAAEAARTQRRIVDLEEFRHSLAPPAKLDGL